MASAVAGRETSLARTRAHLALSRRYAPGLAERRALLFVGDQFAIISALILSGDASVRGADLLDALAVLGLAIVWWIASSAFDAYDIRRAANPIQSVASVWSAFAVTLGAIVLVESLGSVFGSGLVRGAPFAILSLLFLAAPRVSYAFVLTRPSTRRRAVILGDAPQADQAIRLLAQQARAEYEVVGVLPSTPSEVSGAPTQSPLAELVLRMGADEVVNAALETDSDASEQIAALHRAHPDITVRSFSVLYEQLTGKVPIRSACPHWRAVVEARTGSYPVFVKRAMDVVVASAVLVLLAPLFALIAAAIKLDSRGGVIYRQEREGLHGRAFMMLKFRTMIAEAEAGDAIWERHADPRRTRVGKILRPLHLDEAPQLLNVLAGTMSLVGPRPERPQFIRQLEKIEPTFRDRMVVQPGITGWAQVRYGYARSVEDSIEKLEHDLFYVRHWSPFLDLVIGLKTFSALIQRTGKDAPPESAMLTSRADATASGDAGPSEAAAT